MNNNIDIASLTQEQKVVLRLAKLGFLTNGGAIQRALKEPAYANYLISPINDDGTLYPFIDKDEDDKADENPKIEDIIENSPGVEEECEHEPVSHTDIEELFDDDPTNDGEG